MADKATHEAGKRPLSTTYIHKIIRALTPMSHKIFTKDDTGQSRSVGQILKRYFFY